MEWITSILGLVGGGWGTFAAVIALGVFGWIVWGKIQDAKHQKNHEDSKDQFIIDHGQNLGANDKLEGQAESDDENAQKKREGVD